MKNETKIQTINVKQLKIAILKFDIIGTSPYMPEPMDDAILDEINKKRANKVYNKEKITEEEKLKEKFYYTVDEKYGIPSRAFYKAMIRASSYFFEKKDKGMRNIIEGVTIQEEILPLKYEKMLIDKKWGRTSGQSKSPRLILRNAFYEWKTKLDVQFNKSELSAEQIINILNWAGYYIGVGAFRKEKQGSYGQFQVIPITK